MWSSLSAAPGLPLPAGDFDCTITTFGEKPWRELSARSARHMVMDLSSWYRGEDLQHPEAVLLSRLRYGGCRGSSRWSWPRAQCMWLRP
eukprot:gene11540-12921_t